IAEIVVIVPLALIYFRAPPEVIHPAAPLSANGKPARLLGWPPNLVFAMMCGASVLCCVPMAMPQGHLVAFCSDLGISRSIGAMMLSVLLGTAFLSRQIWGAISDRIGGLATVLIGSAWQAISMTAFLFTQNEAGLFTIAAAFGLGFSGIIPAYVLALRELFPASEASWRIPTFLLFSGFGMAAGGWLAGVLYDHFGTYAPAFAAGIGANLINLLLVGALVARQRFRAAYASASDSSGLSQPDLRRLRSDLCGARVHFGLRDRAHGMVDHDRPQSLHADGAAGQLGLADEFGRDDRDRGDSPLLQLDGIAD